MARSLPRAPWLGAALLALLASCKRDLPPPPIAVDLARPSRYEQSFTPSRNEPTVWSVIVVHDGRDSDRAGGQHPVAPGLQLRLTVVDRRGAVVSDRLLDQATLIYGHNWSPPDTAVLLSAIGLRGGERYRFALEVITPTPVFGDHPMHWMLALAGK